MMKSLRRKKNKELEATAVSVLRQTTTPPPSSRLEEYGLQHVLSRAERGETAESTALKERCVFRNSPLLRRVVLVMVIIPLLLILFTTGAYALSNNALPGSTLYGAKIFFERARLTFTLSSTNDTRLEMEFSCRRVDELEKMVASGSEKGADRWLREYQRNLNGVRALIESAPQEDSKNLYAEFEESLEQQASVMEELEAQAPPGLTQIIEKALAACNEERELFRESEPSDPDQVPYEPGEERDESDLEDDDSLEPGEERDESDFEDDGPG